MLIVVLSLPIGAVACSSAPSEPPALQGAEARSSVVPLEPVTASVALVRVQHPAYFGRELWIDGEPRGPLPLDVVLPHGAHTFEVDVGDAPRWVVERSVEPGAGVQILDLAP